LGQVTDVVKTVGADKLYEKYVYNRSGQITHTYSSHQPLMVDYETVRYEETEDLDIIAIPTTVSIINPKHLKSITEYTPLGQVLKQKFVKGSSTTGWGTFVDVYSMKYKYDIRDRLTDINNVNSSFNAEKFAAQYSYNEVNQITKAQFFNPTTSNYADFKHRYQVQYRYDVLNRLTATYYASHADYNAWNSTQGYSLTDKYGEFLSYDANGNVLSLKRTNENAQLVDNLTLDYKAGSNQLMSVRDAVSNNKLYPWDAASSSNTYDDNGNLISGDGATNITYDVRNLPMTLQKNGNTIIYRYNAAGQRIYKKSIGNVITEEHYIMNGSEMIAVMKNGTVNYWKTSYGRYERSANYSFTARYYLTDHLGSTRVVIDESGTRLEAFDYYAFGLMMPGRGFGNNTKERFTSKERDLETGWDYFGARYYNPTIARWMNVDPLQDIYPSHSPYNYVLNSPLMLIDPDGNCTKELTGKDNFTGKYKQHNCENGLVSLQEITVRGTKQNNSSGRGSIHNRGNGVELSAFARGRAPVHTEYSRRQGRAALATIAEGFIEAFSIIRVIGDETELNTWAREMREEAGWKEGDYGSLFFSIYGGIFAGGRGGPNQGLTTAGFSGRGLWALTAVRSSVILRHGRFGTFFKSKSDGLWWSIDRAGHGGSAFKVFKESRNGLEWIHDADEFGDFIIGKHKGGTGILIPWNQLNSIR
jgi:RHS repeat-associated protein